jgi:hypothetical protein
MFDSRPRDTSLTNNHGFKSFIDISSSDMNRFKALKSSEKQLFTVMKNWKKRGEIVAEEED